MIKYLKSKLKVCRTLIIDLQQSQSLPSTRVVSRASSICLSDPGYLRADDVEMSVVSPRRPGLLRVPAISNQEISTNNNDVNYYCKPIYTFLKKQLLEPHKLVIAHVPSKQPPSLLCHVQRGNRVARTNRFANYVRIQPLIG